MCRRELFGSIGDCLFELCLGYVLFGWSDELHELLLGLLPSERCVVELHDLFRRHLCKHWCELLFKLHGGNVRAELGHVVVFQLRFRHLFFVVRIKCVRKLLCRHVSIHGGAIILHELSVRQLLHVYGAVGCDRILFAWLLFSGSCE